MDRKPHEKIKADQRIESNELIIIFANMKKATLTLFLSILFLGCEKEEQQQTEPSCKICYETIEAHNNNTGFTSEQTNSIGEYCNYTWKQKDGRTWNETVSNLGGSLTYNHSISCQ